MNIIRGDVNETCAYSGYVVAGDFVFVNFCVGNIGKPVKEQVEGALDNMQKRLGMIDLDLDNVVQVNVLMRDVWNIPIMEKVFKDRFKGKYPARKTLSTEFAHKGGFEGLLVQMDAIAYKNEQ